MVVALVDKLCVFEVFYHVVGSCQVANYRVFVLCV